MDSGTPSSSAPIAIAVPLPACSLSEGCWSSERFRCRAPCRASATLATTYTKAPPRKPISVAVSPPVDSASATRSKASAEMSTPAPKDITDATTGRGTRTNQATSAPTTSAPPASNPHRPAWSQIGTGPLLPIRGCQPVPTCLRMSIYAQRQVVEVAEARPGARRLDGRPRRTRTDATGPASFDTGPVVEVRRRGQASGSGGELHAGVGVAAVPERVLRQVLLVVVLRVEVRGVGGRPDLGGDVTEAPARELVAVDLGQLAGDLLLLGRRVVDRGAVLGADVIALAVALGRVVDLEERLDEVGVGDLLGVEHDPHRL